MVLEFWEIPVEELYAFRQHAFGIHNPLAAILFTVHDF